MQNKTPEKTIIILGIAHSGTSLVSGLLNILGVKMSLEMNPSTKNPGGSYDDPGVITLMYTMDIDRNWRLDLKEEDKGKYDKDIKELMEARRKPHELWGWKSALTHFYLDMFLPHTHNPHLVFVYRNPLDIIKSGIHHKIETQDLTLAVSRDTKSMVDQIGLLGKIIKEHSDLPQIFTTYEAIKKDPIKEAEALAQFLDVTLEQKHIDKIKEFVITDYSSWGLPLIAFKNPLRRSEYMKRGILGVSKKEVDE